MPHYGITARSLTHLSIVETPFDFSEAVLLPVRIQIFFILPP